MTLDESQPKNHFAPRYRTAFIDLIEHRALSRFTFRPSPTIVIIVKIDWLTGRAGAPLDVRSLLLLFYCTTRMWRIAPGRTRNARVCVSDSAIGESELIRITDTHRTRPHGREVAARLHGNGEKHRVNESAPPHPIPPNRRRKTAARTFAQATRAAA